MDKRSNRQRYADEEAQHDRRLVSRFLADNLPPAPRKGESAVAVIYTAQGRTHYFRASEDMGLWTRFTMPEDARSIGERRVGERRVGTLSVEQLSAFIADTFPSSLCVSVVDPTRDDVSLYPARCWAASESGRLARLLAADPRSLPREEALVAHLLDRMQGSWCAEVCEIRDRLETLRAEIRWGASVGTLSSIGAIRERKRKRGAEDENAIEGGGV